MPGPKPGMEARVNLFGDPGRTFHGVVQGIAWRVLPLSGQTSGVFPKIDPTLNWARLHNAFRCGSSSTHPRLTPRFVWDDRSGHNHRLPARRQTAEGSGHGRRLRAVQSMTEIVAASTPEDPALRFIRRELAPLARALDRYSGLHRAGGDRSDCNRHLPHSVSGSRLRRHPAATMQPVQRPFRQAVDATGAALLGAGFAVLLAITTYEQPSRSVETIAADLNDKVDLAGSRRRCARTQALHCR